MTEHETLIARQLWMLIFRFLGWKKFQPCVAEDVAGDMVTGMMESNSNFLQGGYPSWLPRCLRQEALSKAFAAKRKSDRLKNHEHDIEQRSPPGLTAFQEAQFDHVKKFLGEANVEKLTSACQDKKPRQSDLAESIDLKPKRWRAIREEIRATIA